MVNLLQPSNKMMNPLVALIGLLKLILISKSCNDYHEIPAMSPPNFR